MKKFLLLFSCSLLCMPAAAEGCRYLAADVYDMAIPFQGGIARVVKNGEEAIIDEKDKPPLSENRNLSSL